MGTQLITYDGTNAPTSTMGPADGDAPIQASDVVPGLQAAGDVAWNALLRVTPLATIAALAAIATPTNGLTKYVLGFGFYTFQTTVTTITTGEPYVVAAADATPGRWVSQVVFMRQGAVGGAATGSRVVPGNMPIGVSAVVAFTVNQDAMAGVAGTDFRNNVSGVEFLNANNASTDARQATFALNAYLHHGAILSQAYARIQPAGHANVPARPPRLAIVRYALNPYTGTPSNLYSGAYYEDAPASGAAYSASHEFGGSLDQNHTIDLENYAYAAIVSNEASTNAVLGLRVNGIRIVQG